RGTTLRDFGGGPWAIPFLTPIRHHLPSVAKGKVVQTTASQFEFPDPSRAGPRVRPQRLGGLRGGKRQARLRGKRKNVNSARVHETLLNALHDDKWLHHRFAEPVPICPFMPSSHQHVRTFRCNEFL